jgi:serine/threonine protein kinase
MIDPATNVVQDIFLDLLDLPAEAREQHLQQRCGDDEPLKARVRKLLEADAENAHDQTFASPAADLEAEPIPLRVGNYTVRAVVGEGGMGAVYDAIHEPTSRRAAVKLIRAGIATSSARERFRIEAETLGRLDDPGIAHLYDAGLAEVEWREGAKARRPFIAMEFVEDAVSCVEFARQQKLSARECVKLIEPVARAVQHAHQRGVIHRDLKPGNVLVTRDGRPKVVDFGIARLLDATAADGITITGQVLGTVRYMSPEQAAGDPRQVDTRADIYSLGAILYEMLAGKPLVDAGSGSSFSAAVHALKSEPPKLASIKPELAGDLDAIVHKAIERDPNDRYGSAVAFADDLARYLDGREVSARAPTTVERFVRVVKRNKGKFAAAAVIAISLIGGIIGTTWGLIRAERARRNEVEQRQIAQANEAKATDAEADTKAYGDFLANRVLAAARPKDEQAGLGVNVSVVEALEQAEKLVEDDFKNRPRAEALARHAIGVTWRNLGRYEQAEPELRRAIELRQHTLGPGHPLTLESSNSLAVVLCYMGRFDEAIPLLKDTIAAQTATLGADDNATLLSMKNLASCYDAVGRPNEALPLLQLVLEKRRRVLGPEARETLVTLNEIGTVYINMRRYEEALPVCQEACDKFRATLGPDHPDTLRAMDSMAGLFRQLKQPAKAVPLMEHVLKCRRTSYGPDHKLTLQAIDGLATSYFAAGESAKGVNMAGEYVAAIGRLRGTDSVAYAKTLLQVSKLLHRYAQPNEAVSYLRQCISLLEQHAPDEPTPLADAQCLLGECLAAQGKSDEALAALTSGVEGLDRQPSLSPPIESRRQNAGKVLVQLLETTTQKEQAESWKAKLATPKPTTVPSTSSATQPR